MPTQSLRQSIKVECLTVAKAALNSRSERISTGYLVEVSRYFQQNCSHTEKGHSNFSLKLLNEIAQSKYRLCLLERVDFISCNIPLSTCDYDDLDSENDASYCLCVKFII